MATSTLYAYSQHRLSGSRVDHRLFADFRDRGDVVQLGERRIFLDQQGTGTPVLLLHGIPTFSFVWRDVAPVVALEARALAPDLLGFGLSEKPRDGDYSVEAQATLMLDLLDQLGIARTTIVAHDFGALVAAELLARAPERVDQLILLNTSLRRPGWAGGLSPLSLLRVPLAGELAMALAQRWMLTLAMRVYVARRDRLTPGVMTGYWWPFQHGFKRTLLRLSRGRWLSDDRFVRWRAALTGFDRPCLIVWGALDPTFRLDEAHDLQGLMPAARLEIFEHANHFVSEDRPLALGRLITAFLREPATRTADTAP